MIETVGELQEALKDLDPSLRLHLVYTDKAPHQTDAYLLPEDGIYQVSADFVRVRVGWFHPDRFTHRAPAL